MVFRKISLVFIMLFAWGNSAHAVLTCQLNQSATSPPASAIGTLTVNQIGTGLTAANFTAWNIVITVNSSTGTLTNGTLDLGTDPPTITSTATSLTITPVPMASLPTDASSNFFISNGTQMYGLMNDSLVGDFSENFVPVGTSNIDQNVNRPVPTALNLTCCVTGVTCLGGAVSAPIDLISDKKSQHFSKEISIK